MIIQLVWVEMRPEGHVLIPSVSCLLDTQTPGQSDFLRNALPTCWAAPAWIPPDARRLSES